MSKDEPKTAGGRSPPTRGAPTPILSDTEVLLGRQLRAYFEKIIAEPIPERISALVDRLGEAEAPPEDQRRGGETPEENGAA